MLFFYCKQKLLPLGSSPFYIQLKCSSLIKAQPYLLPVYPIILYLRIQYPTLPLQYLELVSHTS